MATARATTEYVTARLISNVSNNSSQHRRSINRIIGVLHRNPASVQQRGGDMHASNGAPCCRLAPTKSPW